MRGKAEFGWNESGRQGRRKPLSHGASLSGARRSARRGRARIAGRRSSRAAAVCPACRHHLRFESRRGGEQQPQAASQVVLKVSGQFAREAAAGPGEYHVVVVIRDAGGAELCAQSHRRRRPCARGRAQGGARRSRSSTRTGGMTLKIAELHHFAVRIPPGPDAVGAACASTTTCSGSNRPRPWDRPGDDLPHQRGSAMPRSISCRAFRKRWQAASST